MKVTLPANILIAGATGAGKSYFTLNTLLPALKGQYDVLVICSPTLNVNGDYDAFKEDNKTLFKVSSNIAGAVDELIQSQTEMFKAHRSGVLDRDQIPRILVVLDDCLGDNIVSPNGVLSKFSIKARHYGMSFIVMTQRIAGISRQVRCNSAYMFLFSCMNYTELERFLLEYCPKKYHREFQTRIIDVYNEPYNYIYVNNREQNIHRRLHVRDTLLTFS